MVFMIESHCRKPSLLLVVLVGALFVLSACGPLPDSTQASASPSPGKENAQATPTAREVTPADPEAVRLMNALIDNNVRTDEQAIEQILAKHDRRFISVFIEILRAKVIGLVTGSSMNSTIDPLEALSGEEFGRDWPAWVEWYGGTDLGPPPGFTGWKGRLLARIDPRFSDFLQDGLPSDMRVEEIVWGGVMVDGIPALDDPGMIEAMQADYLEPDEPVFGISINGESQAYPLRIMDWHEMVNDIVGGVPVSLAYCTLCGAGIAFDGRGPDGTTYTFGSSGLLYRSNKLMYDRQTRTLWNQLTGRPVLGELVRTGKDEPQLQLELLPVVLTSWEAWQAQHPDTLVLDIDTGYQRPYELGAAYGAYFESDRTMFPVWERDGALPAKTRVYALRVDGVPKAYPLEALTQAGVVNDEIAGREIVLIAARGEVEVTGTDRRSGDVVYQAGGEVRAFERAGQTFSAGHSPDVLLDAAGNRWQITENALIGPVGERLARVNGHLAYWFGWYAFFPQTLLYRAP